MFNTRLFHNRVALLAALMALAAAAPRTANGQTAAKDANDKQRALIEILRSDSPAADKAIACKQLAVYGTKNAVPELARLVSDERLSSWARTALEAIPGPEADEALRKTLGGLQGRLLIGAINSIGVRRDAHAVDSLAERLRDKDADVASAAAVALGRIGGAAATKTLRQSLAGTTGALRSAVAEGCILTAERLMAEGHSSEAAKIYDEIRQADVPTPRILEATRGAILARKTEGIPLLIEQLRSPDRGLFRIGLTTARELSGREVTDAVAAEVANATPERAALLLRVLADRNDAVVSPAVLQVVKSGPKPVRIAAIGVLGRLGDASSVPTLLEIAIDADAELAATAKAALVSLKGDKVDAEISARLPKAEGKSLSLLIELVGQRRIDATPALVKAVDHPDAEIRGAALTALGAAGGPKSLSVLISHAVTPKNPGDGPVALLALRAASVRMPDRESCAEQIAAALPRASAPTKPVLLEILGAVGGAKALATIGAAAKSNDPQLQDTGSRLLGAWMSVDAAPVLLDLAKTAPDDKFQSRALRGYVRLARQFTMPDRQRAEMCQNALAAATRADEEKLVLEVLQRYPSLDTLKVSVKAAQVPALRNDATRVALVIAQKLGGKSAEALELLAKIGQSAVKLEVVKAQYGAGTMQKDVTAVLAKSAGNLPLIVLPSATYNATFGGDPAPGKVKQLKIQYRINGKSGEASFAENAVILLPVPK